MKFLQLRPLHRFLTGLALLVLVTLVGYQVVTAQPDAAPDATELVAGSYSGTVVINEPAPLGSLNLFLDITSVNGALSGQVNAIKTQVFLGGPTFTGSVTANQGVTPTLRIESQTFSGLVSGRTVQRHFVLTGEVLAEGDTLQGEYTETIVGFKPKPMLVKGTFLLVRPSGVTAIITSPAPNGSTPTNTPAPGGSTPTPGQTATPTVTPTPTIPSGNSGGSKVFLPVVSR